MAAHNKKTGILDLTRGELGTRGSAEQRAVEAAEAARILQLRFRDNAGFQDGFFCNDAPHQRALIRWIRHLRPAIVIANALNDRHPDHRKAAELARDACFLSGLTKIETYWQETVLQHAWRPQYLLHYIQNDYRQPSIVIDTTDFFEQKKQAIQAFRSQFYDPNSTEPTTFISTPWYQDFIAARDRSMGNFIGVPFAEGFEITGPVDLLGLAALLK
jgi:bacillithiol biosynthesis deacetylase BshB1